MKSSIELLIKPASGNCNLECSYCFYADEQKNREMINYGIMDQSTLEKIVKRTLENATQSVSFMFQGGEPTLAGLDYYIGLRNFENKYNNNNIAISHAIQTNGYTIDENWAKFLGENNFLVGISMDGTRELHDKYRKTNKGEPTYDRIIESIDLLKKYNVQFNIITVVNHDISLRAKEVYDVYRQKEFLFQQYIPCIDPFGYSEDNVDFLLKPGDYSRFLKQLFDCWYDDISNGRFVYNRYFENLVGIIKGYYPESCGMAGICMEHYVIEADGRVYPCDFYVLDDYCIGNILQDSFEDLDEARLKLNFVKESTAIDESCRSCRWINICRGGCRRDREGFKIGSLQQNKYCDEYKAFFEHSIEKLLKL